MPQEGTIAEAAGPPRGMGHLARREMRLAYSFLVPTLLIVFAIVLGPLFANFWISVKSVRLADLRSPTMFVNERLHGDIEQVGDTATLQYRLRNSSQDKPLEQASFSDAIPDQLKVMSHDARCTLDGQLLTCDLGRLEAKQRETLTVEVVAQQVPVAKVRDSEPQVTVSSQNVLTSFDFTWENFDTVFSADEFWTVLKVSIYYTVFGTAGALVLGLFAAQMLNKAFAGRGILRGLFLFPYVAPVIAVAFAWVILLDPFTGTVNAMLVSMGIIGEPINFFGQRYVELDFFGLKFDLPLALTMVIAFEAWRYFPLSFLFILARMQSISSELYEAAEMDGATPLQQFWFISLPQIIGILAVLFLLRFIWTFNKFDDIFLLTGGASGTRTLTVNVYEQAFAISNLGAGAAVAVVIFVLLLCFSVVFVKYSPKDEG